MVYIRESLKEERLGAINYNSQGCQMKVIEYKDNKNIVIQFQDDYKYECITSWSNFEKGKIKNPYYPTVYGVGIIGSKYPYSENGENNKEYVTWKDMLRRSYNKKGTLPSYKDVICCEEWLYYENFYEWLHSQENFDKWKNLNMSSIDKDILVKGNKIYSPSTCCLVPHCVNNLFDMPNNNKLFHGVYYNKKNTNKKYFARCRNVNISSNHIYLGSFYNDKD